LLTPTSSQGLLNSLQAEKLGSESDSYTFGFVVGRVRDWLRRHRARSENSHQRPNSDLTLLLELDPFTILGSFVDRLSSRFTEKTSRYRHYDFHKDPWWNPLQHHIVVCAAIYHQMIKEADKHNSSKPNSMEEYGGFSLTAIRPVLAILTTLRGRDAQMATEVTEEVNKAACYRHLEIFWGGHSYEAFRRDEEEWESEEDGCIEE
jgi:hypothetical protein